MKGMQMRSPFLRAAALMISVGSAASAETAVQGSGIEVRVTTPEESEKRIAKCTKDFGMIYEVNSTPTQQLGFLVGCDILEQASKLEGEMSSEGRPAPRP